ncbi:hypothetical protein M758_12G178700 [Ceratodon purpureus]|nr:hypothetical protein M758_12G178700 [Ceratodon purpureus]
MLTMSLAWTKVVVLQMGPELWQAPAAGYRVVPTQRLIISSLGTYSGIHTWPEPARIRCPGRHLEALWHAAVAFR